MRARLRGPDGTDQTCDAAYLTGCDGAHSRVREVLATGFPGGTYAHLFYVADVEASGPVMDRELHVALDAGDFLAVFPLKASGRARLIGTVLPNAAEGRREISWDDVSKTVIERMRIAVGRVNWFSTYHVHHRVAAHFREGRAFLLGDAVHIHSPVGGQGMNTGIGDAINLAWKLAAVLRGAADPELLDSYAPERIGFARRLVATTDRIFTLVTRDDALVRCMRLHVVPRLVPAAFAFLVSHRFLFRTVSQLVVNYRGCSLSEGTAGDVRGGDRLPWIPLGDAGRKRRDNFTATCHARLAGARLWRGFACPRAALRAAWIAAARIRLAAGDATRQIGARRRVPRPPRRLCRAGGPDGECSDVSVLSRCHELAAARGWLACGHFVMNATGDGYGSAADVPRCPGRRLTAGS